MKTLIVEDDFTSRLLLQSILSRYGECHVAVDGEEAIEAFRRGWVESDPYDLICMDIMMPRLDGDTALAAIRHEEEQRGIAPGDGVKIIMTTALRDKSHVFGAFRKNCDAYLFKPLDKVKLLSHLMSFGLIESIST